MVTRSRCVLSLLLIFALLLPSTDGFSEFDYENAANGGQYDDSSSASGDGDQDFNNDPFVRLYSRLQPALATSNSLNAAQFAQALPTDAERVALVQVEFGQPTNFDLKVFQLIAFLFPLADFSTITNTTLALQFPLLAQTLQLTTLNVSCGLQSERALKPLALFRLRTSSFMSHLATLSATNFRACLAS